MMLEKLIRFRFLPKHVAVPVVVTTNLTMGMFISVLDIKTALPNFYKPPLLEKKTSPW